MTRADAVADATSWIVAQPLGIAVLLLVIVGFVTERIVTGAAYARERARADKLAETVETALRSQAESLETDRLVLGLILGLDEAVRGVGGAR